MTRTDRWRGVRTCGWLLLLIGMLVPGAAPARADATPGIRFYDIGTGKNGLGNLTAGADGSAWFHEGYTNQIGRVTHDGAVTRFSPPTQRETAILNTVVAAPDGDIWFTEYAAKQIGRLDPNGTIAEYPFDTGKGFLVTPAVAQDGSVWFAEPGFKRVGRITADGTISHFPADPAPFFLTAAADGNMWFTTGDYTTAGTALGMVTRAGLVSYLPLRDAATGPIVYGPGDAFWVMAAKRPCGGSYCSDLWRVRPDGTVTSLGLDRVHAYPSSLAVGADGNVWLGFYGVGNGQGFSGGRIARVTPAGHVTEYALPDADFALVQIAASPDGDLLFSERQVREEWGRIGRLDPSVAVPLADTPDFTPATG